MHLSHKPNLRDKPIVKYPICKRWNKEHAYSSYHEQESPQIGFLCLFRNKGAKGRYQRVLEVVRPSAVGSMGCRIMTYRRPKRKGIAILHILICRIIKLRHVAIKLGVGLRCNGIRCCGMWFREALTLVSTSPRFASPTDIKGLFLVPRLEASAQPLRRKL